MRNLITVLAIVFCTTCFSQKLSISKGSYKTESVIKIEFPIDYTLRFFKNDKLIKKEKFKGERLYKIENFDQYELIWKDHKMLGYFDLIFRNELEEFKEDLILENQMDY